MSTRLEKSIFRKIRNANLKYGLIENGDRIAVGYSGGKDSYALLYFLQLLLKYTPLDFSLQPVYIDLGWKTDTVPLHETMGLLGVDLIEEQTNISDIVFGIRKGKNPCAICSHLRRGVLNRMAKKLNCNKVALGHHRDDVVNTLLISILFEGHFKVFKPITYLDQIDLHIIRPLLYVPEKEITSFAKAQNYVALGQECPAEGQTMRNEVDSWLNIMEEKHPQTRQNILKSIENVNQTSFWNPHS